MRLGELGLELQPQPQALLSVTGAPSASPSPLPCPELAVGRDISELHIAHGVVTMATRHWW